jgi:hypothetical protein
VNIPGLARALRALADVPSRMSREGAAAITSRMQSQFSQGADPYGATWKALATGEAAHLIRSGAMSAATKATPMAGGGLTLDAPSPANFHQAGTSRMPARPVLPAKGLPATWRADLQAIYSRIIGEGIR